ncbi:MAG TPA: CBS domain-containing protein [Bdellovibrionota bacterium]|jgi:acetoin utilization protein AcuB|nr:CBS domain-containing protein [Bdellovibrionota bacterium]
MKAQASKSKTIRDVMTPQPHTIGRDIPIDTALNKMNEYRVRHLPVLHGGHLVGMVSDRDLKLVIALETKEPFTVEDVMNDEPYAVRPETPISEVVATMAEKRLGSAIIQGAHGEILGIFTSVDGLKLLAQQLGA